MWTAAIHVAQDIHELFQCVCLAGQHMFHQRRQFSGLIQEVKVFFSTCVPCGWIHFVDISLTSVYPLPGSRFEVFGKRLPPVPILHFMVPAGRD